MAGENESRGRGVVHLLCDVASAVFGANGHETCVPKTPSQLRGRLSIDVSRMDRDAERRADQAAQQRGDIGGPKGEMGMNVADFGIADRVGEFHRAGEVPGCPGEVKRMG